MYSTSELQKKANEIRIDIINMLLEAKSGHAAGPIGLAEIFVSLYFEVLKHDPRNPNWEERDRLVLSNGHVCPVLYAALASAGYFPKEELQTLRKLGSRLQGHPSRLDLPGVENSSGPLGQGFSQAVGMALANKIDNKPNQVYCIMGDGEQDEGQCWEAYMFAAKYNLNNLTVIIDRNNIQIDGHTEDVMPLEPLHSKLEAFGWFVIDIDGHNIEEIIDACNKSKAIFEKPVAIIAHTIPGKGIDFMENVSAWHGKPPKADEAKRAIDQIRTLGNKIQIE